LGLNPQKVRIAITDACIFIDLLQLEIVPLFFLLDIEVHTSLDVVNELYPHQQAAFTAFENAGKLVVHNLSAKDRVAILQHSFPRSLSTSDQTVIYLAIELQALILSSDKVIRRYAKKAAIDYHGMIWIFDELVRQGLLEKPLACLKLRQLIKQNCIYQNNLEMNAELDKRIREWEK
jgi:predicted nucleic acid-binding protein